MMRTKYFALVALVSSLTVGCGEEVADNPPNPCDQQQPTAAVGDGDHEIQVQQPDGSVDNIWIHAKSPAEGTGPFPVIVFAPGQDNFSTFNCSPDGPAPFDTALADTFAGLGFLTVVVGFRNQSNHAPGLGTFRPRDHYILDTRAFLAAARWAWLEHGKGSRHMAYIGHGLGTLPATWAATTDVPELKDLQSCLAPRTLILAGGSANLIDWNNVTDENYAFNDPETKLRVNLQGLESLLLHTLSSHARALGMQAETYAVADVTATDLTVGPLADLLFQDLTVPGLQLVNEIGLTAADTEQLSALGCGDLQNLPPMCDLGCAEATTRRYVNFDDTLIFNLNHWAKDHGVGSIGWWEPPAKTAPGETELSSSILLRSLHDASPAYMAKGIIAKRALHLLGDADQNRRPEAQQLLADKLFALGAQATAPALTDAMGCGHGDYFSVPRSACGWSALVAELTEVFPTP